jgi:hypothetical protein
MGGHSSSKFPKDFGGLRVVRADVKADAEKVKANFGHSMAEKKAAYEEADTKANAEKAKSDVENKIVHAKADVENKITHVKADALK